MPYVTCPQCGGSHPKWDCRATAKQIAAHAASKAASAAAPSHRPSPKSGELSPNPPKGRASGKKGAATKTTNKESQAKAGPDLALRDQAGTATPTGPSGTASRSRKGRGANRETAPPQIQADTIVIEDEYTRTTISHGGAVINSEAKFAITQKAVEVELLARAEADAAHLAPKRGRGRPSNVEAGKQPFDKKAYDRKKAADKRAADKAERARLKAEKEGKS